MSTLIVNNYIYILILMFLSFRITKCSIRVMEFIVMRQIIVIQRDSSIIVLILVVSGSVETIRYMCKLFCISGIF